jgi:hypothetical protein
VLVSLAVLVGGLAWQPAARAQNAAPASPPAPAAGPAAGIIFVLNGSGGGFELTNGLLKAMSTTQDRFCVDTVIWSRFQCAPKDHDDHQGHFAGAQQLSSRILQLRGQQPHRKIYIAAFSSGNRVALEATKQLPPSSVDRIILLAPSVAFFYDLGPALRASRDGIDAFYSYEDPVLEAVVASRGTADGYLAPAAGRIGFWLPAKTAPNFPLYQQKLRQYPWQTGFIWTGHRGKHTDWNGYVFLANYVLPLLRESEARPKIASAG